MLIIYFNRLKKNKAALFGISVIAALAILALAARYISLYDPAAQNIVQRLQPPSLHHWMGTDDLGRDVFSRMLYGVRISLIVGLTAVGIMAVIGTALGIISGYFGGRTDVVIMRFVDIMLCFPTFFLIILVIAFLEPSIYNVMAVIGLTSWPGLTRLVRAEVLSLRNREFIEAADLLGLSHIRIFFVHILPNVMSPVLVAATLGVGDAILTESGLSFLGLGVQPPASSWGQMLSAGKDYIYFAWWLSVFPGLAIFMTVMSFNMMGEGLRDVMDPKT